MSSYHNTVILFCCLIKAWSILKPVSIPGTLFRRLNSVADFFRICFSCCYAAVMEMHLGEILTRCQISSQKRFWRVQTNVQLAHDMKNTIPASSCFSCKNVDHVVFHVFFYFFLVFNLWSASPLATKKRKPRGSGLGCISASLVLLHVCWRSTNKSVSTDPAAKPKWSQSKAHCHGTKGNRSIAILATWEIQRNMVWPEFSFCSSCFMKEPGNLWRQCDGSQTF